MVQIKCRIVEGLIPTERIAEVPLADGGVEEVVSEALVEGDALEAAELGRRDGRVLVELPMESASGNWRVWVSQEAIR